MNSGLKDAVEKFKEEWVCFGDCGTDETVYDDALKIINELVSEVEFLEVKASALEVINKTSKSDAACTDAIKTKILYECDRRKCCKCDDSCKFTSDIRHAENFICTPRGDFVENIL